MQQKSMSLHSKSISPVLKQRRQTSADIDAENQRLANRLTKITNSIGKHIANQSIFNPSSAPNHPDGSLNLAKRIQEQKCIVKGNKQLFAKIQNAPSTIPSNKWAKKVEFYQNIHTNRRATQQNREKQNNDCLKKQSSIKKSNYFPSRSSIKTPFAPNDGNSIYGDSQNFRISTTSPLQTRQQLCKTPEDFRVGNQGVSNKKHTKNVMAQSFEDLQAAYSREQSNGLSKKSSLTQHTALIDPYDNFNQSSFPKLKANSLQQSSVNFNNQKTQKEKNNKAQNWWDKPLYNKVTKANNLTMKSVSKEDINNVNKTQETPANNDKQSQLTLRRSMLANQPNISLIDKISHRQNRMNSLQSSSQLQSKSQNLSKMRAKDYSKFLASRQNSQSSNFNGQSADEVSQVLNGFLNQDIRLDIFH